MTVRTLRRHLGCVAGSESKMNIRLQSSDLGEKRSYRAFSSREASRFGGGVGGKGQAARGKKR